MLGLYTPPLGFHFAIKMAASPDTTVRVKMGKFKSALGKLAAFAYDNSFQEVSGLSATVQTETIQAGGVNNFVYKVPKGVEYSNLVLKRGLVTLSSELQTWCEDTIKNDDSLFKYTYKDVTLMLLNHYHMPIKSWKIIKAYPVKYEISGFDAMSSKIMVENIELCYQRFEAENSGLLGAMNKINSGMQIASMATGSIQKAVNAASETVDKVANSVIGQAEKMAKDVTEWDIDKPDIDTDMDIDPGFDTY